MAAIAAISSVTCLGGLFDNALKAVTDTAKAVTVSPGETREDAERARQKALLEDSERIKEENRKKIEAEKAKEEQEEKKRVAKEQKNSREQIVRACIFAKRGDADSVYVNDTLKQAFKGSVQYATNSIIRTHIPIYKEITSGTSFGYVIDKGYVPEGTTRMKASPFVVPGVNYQGCLFDMGQGLGLCCTVSKTEEKVAGGFSFGFVEEPLVEVFGMRKEFPKSTTVKEVAETMQKKYQSLKLNESQEADEFLCMDFLGFSKKVNRRKIQFENDDLQGSCVGEEVQFNKVDWNSDAAAMWLRVGFKI